MLSLAVFGSFPMMQIDLLPGAELFSASAADSNPLPLSSLRSKLGAAVPGTGSRGLLLPAFRPQGQLQGTETALAAPSGEALSQTSYLGEKELREWRILRLTSSRFPSGRGACPPPLTGFCTPHEHFSVGRSAVEKPDLHFHQPDAL